MLEGNMIRQSSFLRYQLKFFEEERLLPFDLFIFALILCFLLAQLPFSCAELLSHHCDLAFKAFFHLLHLLHEGLLVAA